MLGAAIRLAEWLVRSLPPEALLSGAAMAGDVWRAIDGRRRDRVRENFRLAFGDGRAPAGVGSQEAFRSMARVPAELMLVPRLLDSERAVARRIRYLGDWPALAEDARRGGGVVVTGHLGNWELGAVALARVVPRVRVVARPIDGAPVEDLARRFRGRAGRVIAKRGAMGEALQALRSGEWVAIVGDQDAGRRGTFVPFFGVPASTSSAFAALALRAGVPCYAGACLRRRGALLGFDVHLRRLAPDTSSDAAGRVRDLVAQSTAVLEAWIRQAPDQYNWLHRRWKSRPLGEAPTARVPAYARPAPR
jgi:KDO2-lipid IV(A) lauroyltransferase